MWRKQLDALANYLRNFCRAVKQHRHNRRIYVAVDDEFTLLKTATEITGVPSQLTDPLLTCVQENNYISLLQHPHKDSRQIYPRNRLDRVYIMNHTKSQITLITIWKKLNLVHRFSYSTK